MKAKAILARITSFSGTGLKSYAVTLPEDKNIEGSITFSVKKEVWEDEKKPIIGELVVLREIEKTDKGLRAKKAERYVGSSYFKADELRDTTIKRIKEILENTEGTLSYDESKKNWANWVSLKKPNADGLIQLLEDDTISDSYKMRALLILHTPDRLFSNFDFGGIPASTLFTAMKATVNRNWLLKLSDELVEFLADVVECFSYYLHNKEDEESLEYGTLYAYVITDLLATKELDHSRAQRLFNLLRLKDKYGRYDPFYYILDNKALGYMWKVKADERMREFIKEELYGSSENLFIRNTLYGKYKDEIIRGYESDHTRHYNAELFIDQIRFIMENHPDKKEAETFDKLQIKKIIDVARQVNAWLFSQKFCTYILERNHPEFLIKTQDDCYTAYSMWQMMDEQHPLIHDLKRMIDEFSAKRVAKENKQKDLFKKEKEILEKMKK